ncbi:pantoate--beta-alanine ligase [Flavobacterium sp. SUN046]|uniref:pantoate--beta-alanine ligase n=1 Tax=Flavobacterium sp. SUN046 TaxID=3002440 RepID=UPI002DB91C84|nr:pantoate--beta-alanine ligase [Flavobacterium sp. SUN046]MEC4050277.1 pantoate--beta-alanine ligase [Flavobacterium sp. SUN046]
MLVFNNKVDLNLCLQSKSAPNFSIGFVPTMGALHDGHLSLLKESINNNKLTVISIFVNPTQFNNAEDLEKYPRTLDNDIEKIKTVSEAIIVYAPTVEDIYEGNTTSQHYNFDGLEHQMEGKFRPGHFDGVGTVVKRLFEIVKPNNAYFGEKDFQQLQIIKKLVEKEKLPVTIIGCPIHRDSSGLAMSSRNQRLTDEEKRQATIIYRVLNQAKVLFGTKSAKEVHNYVAKSFAKIPNFDLEYFEIADEKNLLTCVRKSKNKKYRAFIAVFVNKIRLIDTISLN